MEHFEYIKQTFDLARKGEGRVSPNPLVGALIVKNNRIISSGYHAKYGDDHAELAAIKAANESLEGATLYCNLEPCCHTNKQTPPCAQRIIQEKISHVVISNRDPNTAVNGKGIELLRSFGVQVTQGILEEEGELLNEVFFHYMRTKIPFIHIKYAQTLDGMLATASGDSKWISNEQSRMMAHKLRLCHDAILVGANTLINDNPKLTIRYGYETIKPCPWRVILAPLNLINEKHHVVSDEFRTKTIIVSTTRDIENNFQKADWLERNGIRIISSAMTKEGLVCLYDLVEKLSQLKITSLLVEGGSSVITSFIKNQLYDRISVFIAPIILGKGVSVVGDIGISQIMDAKKFKSTSYKFFGDNIYFSALRL